MATPKADSYLQSVQFQLSEVEHNYGPNIHILAHPHLLSLLATLCSPNTHQPVINELIKRIYTSLIDLVANAEFPRRTVSAPTRMAEFHPEGVYQGVVIDPTIKVVTVNIARAGTLPSHVCYEALNYLLPPKQVRQDHISISRQTDQKDKVTGSAVFGHKIGGPIDESFILIPDPMGATGGTLIEVLNLYKDYGRTGKFIALHCIVTPEYLKRISEEFPELTVYAVRLDRGLSLEDVLDTTPGTYWEKERGLNSKQYIVPGGGGFGEILNNSFV